MQLVVVNLIKSQQLALIDFSFLIWCFYSPWHILDFVVQSRNNLEIVILNQNQNKNQDALIRK